MLSFMKSRSKTTLSSAESDLVEAKLCHVIITPHIHLGRTYTQTIQELYVDGICINIGDGEPRVFENSEPRGSVVRVVQIPKKVVESAKQYIAFKDTIKNFMNDISVKPKTDQELKSNR